MRIAIAALLTLLGTCFNLVECRAASVADIKATIDGAYILGEWHTDTGVFRPPQVEGRVVFLNGAVVTILIDKMRRERQVTVAEFGVYELRDTLLRCIIFSGRMSQLGQNEPPTSWPAATGPPQKAAAAAVGLGGRVGPKPAARAAKKVEGS